MSCFNVLWQLSLEPVCCTVSLRFWVKSLYFEASPGFVDLVWYAAEVCVRLIYLLNSELMCCDVILCVMRGVCIWEQISTL